MNGFLLSYMLGLKIKLWTSVCTHLRCVINSQCETAVGRENNPQESLTHTIYTLCDRIKITTQTLDRNDFHAVSSTCTFSSELPQLDTSSTAANEGQRAASRANSSPFDSPREDFFVINFKEECLRIPCIIIHINTWVLEYKIWVVWKVLCQKEIDNCILLSMVKNKG